MCKMCFPPPSDADARWNKPTATSGAVWDTSCECYRGQDFGWSTFISHKHLHRRSFLKNNDLIITADFNGENQKSWIPFFFFLNPISLFSYIFKFCHVSLYLEFNLNILLSFR